MSTKYIFKFELKKINFKFILKLIFVAIILNLLTQTYKYNTLVFFPTVPHIDTYSTIGWLGIIKISDMIIPILSASTVLYIFIPDYDDNINDVMILYNHCNYNKIMLVKWITILLFYFLLLIMSVFLMSKFTVIDGININDMNFIYSLKPTLIIMKSFPTLIWYTTFPLVILDISKNKLIAVSVSTMYALSDICSISSIYPFASMINLNSQYLYNLYLKMDTAGIRAGALERYYIINRITIISVSVFFIIYILKKSLVLKKSK